MSEPFYEQQLEPIFPMEYSEDGHTFKSNYLAYAGVKGHYKVRAKDVSESPREMMPTRFGGAIEVICIPLYALKTIEEENGKY